ncbi:MAG: glucose 1-dehydrogenase [Dehalococcoidales bacterium]|nr:glucose 1-dehydrogenase [Dehalococcoidales bacterium]
MERILDLFSLKGKVAVVTGGNGGIGKAIARGLAAAGADIVIAGRKQAKTADTVGELIKEFGTRVIGIEVDLKDPAQISPFAVKVLERMGRADILVNDAGMNIRKMPQDYALAEWDDVIDTNLRSVFLCCNAFYPALKNSKGGKIINIGSIMSVLSAGNLAPYSASKGGVLQLTKSLAIAWAPDNIQVNVILPGYVSTELTAQAKRDLPTLNDHVIARTPAGRWGLPEDIAGAAVFLASRASDYVTGAALPVDGGFSVLA